MIQTAPPMPRLTFAGHRTYILREQWVSKGLQTVAEAEQLGTVRRVFTHPEATDRFGMGPAMVAALRFWLKATGLVTETKRGPQLIDLGRLILLYDPYLERLERVWVLHLHLTRNLIQTPTWFWLFQYYPDRASFTRGRALEALLPWAIKMAPGQCIRRGALQQDLACLLRMSVPQRLLLSPETPTTSPLQRLALLRYLSDQPGKPGRYSWQAPQVTEVHPLLVLAVLLLAAGPGRSLPLAVVLLEPLQARRSLGLSTEGILDCLARLHADDPAWSPERLRVEGQDRLHLPLVTPLQALEHCYLCP